MIDISGTPYHSDAISGIDWYLDDFFNKRCKDKDLDDLCVFILVREGKAYTRVVYSIPESRVIYEKSTMDGIGAFLDIYKLDNDLKVE